ncbi:Hypothetical protein PHPALM_9938 [Phytophthora palmivora]|uniref:Uncharacterized protein n=1 Tax=Phytophthora palmivora TaxID=4796 RepID=A0A2P4Y601_9STRA|nr:Hypothetical protein PHPALM_9938 [Phytophthora palmivora]
MKGSIWTSDEVWWLVQAWQESVNALKKGKKKKMSSIDFNKLVHEHFVALAGGSSPRTVATISTRKCILQNSFEFIRAFMGNQPVTGDVDWFGMTASHQRKLMQTAGGKEVRPIDERVFIALEKLLKDNDTVFEESDHDGNESDSASSEGDKYEQTMNQKKVVVPKKVITGASTITRTRKSALEEETGELLTQKGQEDVKPKRQRLAFSSKTPLAGNVKDILEHQSQVLTGFLEKRANERSREHEQSRQEREADQKFWAAETEKDRSLLRDLFSHE